MFEKRISSKAADKFKRVVPLPKKAIFNEEIINLGRDWTIESSKELYNTSLKWSKKFGLAGVKEVNGGQDNNLRAEKVLLGLDNNLEEEEYKVNIGTKRIDIKAGSEKGVEYAMQTLWQVAANEKLPTGSIEDRPSLKIRGFNINFGSFLQMGIEDALKALEAASDLKLNAILIDYAVRFPYDKHKRIATNLTLTKEDLKRLNARAKELKLQLIPVQQTIGHLDYILEHDHYKRFRENKESKSQICPLNPDSLELVKELLEEMIEAHPGIKYIDIGADEARSLGKCPACEEKVKKHSVSRLYIDYINLICEFVISKGLTPIMADDILCAHPESIDLLDRRMIIQYWDYWTVSKLSPYFVARHAKRGITCDIGWEKEWKDELNDLESSIVRDFAKKISFEKELNENFMKIFGPYLGNEFPKRIKGFPYLEFYLDKGFKVLGSPTALANGDNYHMLPNYWRFIPNIRAFAERCIETGAEGILTTSWYNYHPFMFHLGIGATAQFAWGLSTEK
jgi:hypothetical protein